MRVLALLVFAVAVVAAVPDPQKIVGGSVTTIENYPSIAAILRTRDWSTYWQDCGGSIINTRAILTAAHCVVNEVAATWRVRVGSTWANSGGVVHNVQSVIVHANYDGISTDNDIAIIRLASTITYNNNVRAGNFAGATYNLPDNQVVWLAGWGTISFGGPSSEQLQHVQVWAINQAVCRQRYATAGGTVTENMLCAGWLDVGGRDACQGDSGGPLYHNNNIVGVTSWGIGCAQAYYPGVYARVSRYITWIQANA